MHIKQKLSQHRRDFTAIYECEHCGHERKGTGYDDRHFHEKVIPAMPCRECGKRGSVTTPRSTPDIPEGLVL